MFFGFLLIQTPLKERRNATVNKIYVPSGPGRCCLWCCWPETTPSRTGCWACPGGRRCWASAPRTSTGGCCTSAWSARPWPRPPPAPPSEGPPGVSSRSSLKRTTDKQHRHGARVRLEESPVIASARTCCAVKSKLLLKPGLHCLDLVLVALYNNYINKVRIHIPANSVHFSSGDITAEDDLRLSFLVVGARCWEFIL